MQHGNSIEMKEINACSTQYAFSTKTNTIDGHNITVTSIEN